MKTRALLFERARVVAVRDVVVPDPGPDQVVARALASAVSQGTELLLYRGEGPVPFDPSLDAPGAPTYPRRYGYAWVGELASGERVFALAPHGDAHVLDAAACRAIRADVPAARATLAANLETAVGCAWDAEIAVGDRAVVLGAGVVGILTAWMLARSGASVELVDPRARRLACAAGLVETTAIARGEADVVVEATGDPRVLDDAIAWTRPAGRVVVASFYGLRRAPIDLGDAFHRRRLVLVASQVSSIPPRLSARWSPSRRFALVDALLAEPALDALLAPPVPFEDAPALYARLDVDEDTLPCHTFAYRCSPSPSPTT